MTLHLAALVRAGQLLDFIWQTAAGCYIAFNPMSHVNTCADFIVVVSNEDDYHAGYHHFADKVNRKLKAGYQLHGQPFNINHTLCQAMVRPEGPQPSGETTIFYKRSDVAQTA
jgi:hypothetical protein